MSLIKAERRRFVKRRMTLWMLVIGVLILGAVTTGLALTHHKPTPAVVADAQARADAAYAQEMKNFEQFRAECEAQAGPDAKEKCQGPPKEYFTAQNFMPPQFEFKKQFGDILIVWAAIISMIGFVLGATFVGAEWSSGSMMNLLTWRPKRLPTLGTKLGVLVGWMTIIGAASFALWTAGLYAVGKFAGNTDGMTSGTWQSFGLSGVRGVAMILAFSALGFGLASLGRHTALALGVAIAVIIVGQIGLGIVLNLAQVKFAQSYLIPVHMYAWLNKSVTLYDYSGAVACGPTGCDTPPTLVVKYTHSGPIALGVVLVVLAAAFVSMRRRDVA